MKRRNPEMKSGIYIVGAGGHGSELASYLPDLRGRASFRLAGFVDDGKAPGPFCGSQIIGGVDRLAETLQAYPRKGFFYITAVGDNSIRRSLVGRLEALRVKNLSPFILRHSNSQVGADVEIGEGTCLAPGSVVTTRARIGRHCILNVNSSVSHDSVIGDFVNVNPGAVICGNTRIGAGCYIGAGAIVIDGVTIGDWTVVGAGATVIDDLPGGITAVGVPAREIRRK